MTTEQLRKEITVTDWILNSNGIQIHYFRSQEYRAYPHKLNLAPEECARQLSCISSIYAWEDNPYGQGIVIHCDFGSVIWSEFYTQFKLSQWEALTLAIRHEAEKELENDANLLEMDKAIEAIKNM